MTRLDSAPGMGEELAQVYLIGRLATAPHVIRTPSGVTVTMLSLAVCDQVHKLVTLGFQAEYAADLEAGHRVYVEGLWQAREEGRRELAVSVLRVLPSVGQPDEEGRR